MPSRAANTKSRNGCSRCKQRRVKCDEGRPCRDCHRRNELCSLVTHPLYIARFEGVKPHSPALSSLSPAKSHQSRESTPQQNVIASLSGHENVYPAFTPSYSEWTKDLYLMSHWVSKASTTLMDRPGIAALFQQVAPELGLDYPHTMHIMLAIAANHLARIKQSPEEREAYITLSLRHQHCAISQFQSAVRSITIENATAMLLSASLLSIMSLTAICQLKEQEAKNPASAADLAALFPMTRGVRDVLWPHHDWRVDSRTACILKTSLLDSRKVYIMPREIADQLNLIKTELLPKQTDHPDGSKEACQFALLELENVMRDVVHFPPQKEGLYHVDYRKRRDLEVDVLLRWTTTVSTTYVNLLKANHVAALVLIAHWVPLFKHLGDKWFIEGFTETALRLIKAALPVEHHHWLGWPTRYFEAVQD